MANLPPVTGADKQPAVSVLVPVHDAAAWLPATLGSLRRLRGVACEVLLVDDGSTDASPALLAEAARRDPHVRVLRRPHEGLVAALNAGLAAARAPYVARLDADDVLHPDRLGRQLARAEAGADVVGTGVRCFPTQRIQAGLRRYEAWQNTLVEHADLALARFVESPLVHPSVLFRADAVRAVGGYRDAGWPEDYDLWLRLFEAGARFCKVPEVLTFWREHPARLTRTAAHCRAEAIRACKVHHLLRGPLAGAPGFWVAGAGPDGKALARDLVAGGARLAGWLDVHPGRVGQRIHGALVQRAEDAALGDGEVVLSAVGGVGGRARVRALFAGLGWVEGARWWAVA